MQGYNRSCKLGGGGGGLGARSGQIADILRRVLLCNSASMRPWRRMIGKRGRKRGAAVGLRPAHRLPSQAEVCAFPGAHLQWLFSLLPAPKPPAQRSTLWDVSETPSFAEPGSTTVALVFRPPPAIADLSPPSQRHHRYLSHEPTANLDRQ